MKFVVYPGVDDQLDFPPAVRDRLAKSSELASAITLKVNDKIPGAVADAVAAAPTVVTAASTAAGTAVSTELAKQGVFNGAFQLVNNSTIAMAFVDTQGNRSWIEVGYDGLPTVEAAAAIATAINGQLITVIDNSLATKPIFQATGSGSGVAVAIVDQDGQRSWLECKDDGTPTDNAIALISAKLNIQSVPTTVKSAYNSADVLNVVSGPDLMQFGDSMTAADWNTKLAQLTGRTVYKSGVGGETSIGIAARANAMPYLMLPAGDSIPASGPVNITLTSSGGGQTWPLLQGAGTGNSKAMGTLAGVPGEMTLVRPVDAVQYVHHANDQYVFTRTTAGAAVTVNRPSPFYYDWADAHRGDIWIIWSGRNNFAEDNGDRAFRDIKAMTERMKALRTRFLVLSVHNGTGEGVGTTNYPLITGLNKRLLAEYGRRFVDHRSYLVQYGLSDLGLTPTTQDTADMAADTIPVSLRADTIHQTVAARDITASLVNLRLRELGWV